MSMLKNLKFLTVVGLAVGFLGVTVTSWADLPPKESKEYFVINVVNNNQHTDEDGELVILNIEQPNNSLQLVDNMFKNSKLKYAKNAFFKYEVVQSPLVVSVELQVGDKRCKINFHGDTIRNTMASYIGNAEFCNSFGGNYNLTGNTLTATINYNGPRHN